MATQLQIRRGTASQIAAFTGAEGEVVVNTTNDSIVVSDGSTAGGFEQARADLNNVSDASLNAALTGNTVSALTITTLTLGSTAITATGAEINILDGVTATAAELNILDGVTATTAELNFVDGVTSAIQTQLDAKAPLAQPQFTNRVGIGVAAHSSDALNITSTNQHIRLNNGSELGILALTSNGDLDFWAHGADEKINFRTGTGSGTVAMNVVGTKVGIGRVPRVELDVAGEVAIAYDANYGLRFYNQPQNNWAFIGNDVTTSAADLRLGDSTGEVMRLKGGNVGISTSNPQKTLDVQGEIAISNSATSYWNLNRDDSTGALTISDTGTQRFAITTAGSVGIGTSSPFGTATNRTCLSVNGSNSVSLNVGTGGSQRAYLYADSSIARLATIGSLPLQLGTNDQEHARLDLSGNFCVGTSNPAPVSNNVQGVSIRSFGELQSSRDGAATLFLNRKSSDGEIAVFRRDGSTFGNISVQQSSLSIGGSSTGAIYFNAGTDVRPWNKTANTNADNTLNLGSSNSRWEEFFCANATINTSDRNEKQDIETLSDAEQRVAVAAKGLLRKYRWKEAVAEKGDNARIHVGIIAQDLQAAFEAEGLDAARYGMWCSDTWTNDDGSEQTRLGVRYSELLAFIIAAI